MNKLPIILIYSRLIMGLTIVFLSIVEIRYFPVIAISLLTIGLLSDIFDGIIARQLNVSTEKLRRLDSTVDQVFFVSVTIAAYIRCAGFFNAQALKLTLLIGLELLAYLISFIKFKKEIATHSIGAKMWTLVLFATLIEIIMECHSTVLFNVCFWLGLVTRLEIIAIIFTLKRWANDVPTLYHALQIRQGKVIRRHKMFNG